MSKNPFRFERGGPGTNEAILSVSQTNPAIPGDERFAFSATVPEAMREMVENLFFFNPRQGDLHQGIQDAVEQTGVPVIIQREGRVWIGVPKGDIQCLFVSDRQSIPLKPVGVLLWGRPSTDVVTVVHLAIEPAYASSPETGCSGLGIALVQRLQQIARSIKGVRRIQLPYRHTCCLRVSP